MRTLGISKGLKPSLANRHNASNSAQELFSIASLAREDGNVLRNVLIAENLDDLRPMLRENINNNQDRSRCIRKAVYCRVDIELG